jgi:hypothetical protein
MLPEHLKTNSLLLTSILHKLYPLAQDIEDLPPKPKQGQVYAQDKRTFSHLISKAAAVQPDQQTTVLTSDQLKQCGYAYINNGIVRGVTDRSVFFIQGERTKAVVEANDELLETSTDEEVQKLQQQIADDTLSIGGEELEDGITTGGQPARIKELKRKIIRLNKRVKLHIANEKGLTSSLVFGRGFNEIIRLPTDEEEWPIYGEPIAIRPLTTSKVAEVFFNSKTGAFEGIDYNTNDSVKPTRFIKATNLIPFFHDDNNILENTQGSGLSAVWPILSVSQSDDVINDEDIPEITRNTGGVLTIIKALTNDNNKLKEIRDKINGKTQEVVGAGLIEDVLSVPLGRTPSELTDVRIANGKYICQCMSLPLFLLYEDTANFATANQTMQVYKAGVLKRYRTWLQGILEDYWYDTILADHLGIEVKDVVSAPIKIKAIFADINFETRREVIDADKILFDMDVMERADVAKDIDRPDLVSKIESQEAEMDDQQKAAVNDTFMNQRNEIAQKNQQLIQQNQQLQNARIQQASAAASIKLKDEEYHHERMKIFANINEVIKKLDGEQYQQ